MKLALAIVTLACGCHSTPHASGADASADGASGSGTARVHAVINNLANTSATVFFLDASSNVLAKVATDSAGYATGPAVAGGFIVVGDTDTGNGTHLDVIADVHAGDDLTSGYSFGAAPLDVPVDAPFDTTGTGATDINIFSSCGSTFMARSTSQPTRATGTMFAAACSGNLDVLAVSTNSSSVPVGTLEETVAVASPPSITMNGSYTAPNSSLAYSITNVPAAATLVQLRIGLDLPSFLLAAPEATPSGGTASLSLPLPALALPYYEWVNINAGNTTDRLYRWTASAQGTSLAIDASTRLLPAFATAPAWDPSTHAATWTETPRGATPTYFSATFVGTNTRVDVRAPYVAGKLQLPVLPMYNGIDPNPGSSPNFTIVARQSPLPWATFRADANHTLFDGATGTAAEIVELVP